MKTKIFEYKNYIGIIPGNDLITKPGGGNIGCVCKIENIEISQSAYDMMQTFQKERGSFAEIMCFDSVDGPMLGWMGYRAVLSKDSRGDRDFNPVLLKGSITDVEVPEDFKEFVNQQR